MKTSDGLFIVPLSKNCSREVIDFFSVAAASLVTEEDREEHRGFQNKIRLNKCTKQVKEFLDSQRIASFTRYLEGLEATPDSNQLLRREAWP